jgi:putative peptidoglycan lipid II flippase
MEKVNPSRALSNNQIARAALVVILGFMASGVLGLLRTSAFAAIFGASDVFDAFVSAQRVPELLFVLVAGGALGSAFIPVFSRYLTDSEDYEQAWQLASATMTLSALAATVLSLLAFVTAPLFVPFYVNDADIQGLTVNLMRLMLLTPIIFSVSGLVMGVLNAHQSFLLPALAISLYNVGQIIGALVITPLLPTLNGEPNIYGLAIGTVLGALLHLSVQLPGLRGIGSRLRWRFDLNTEGVREVLALMGPRVLGLAVVQINFLVNITLSTPMVDGSTSALTVAWTLMFFALGVIAQSVGTALFPTLSALAAENDMDGFRDRLSRAMRSVLFLSLPATVVLILLGEPLIAVIAQRGAWTPEATQATAWALAFFSLGIAGHALLEVLSRAFYALSDTWTPVWVGILAMAANITLSLVFIRFMGEPGDLARGPFAGLALANALTTLVEGFFLWWLMTRRVNGVQDGTILNAVARTALATALLGGVLWWLNGILVTVPPIVHLIVAGISGAIIFFGGAYLLRLDEARTVPRMVLSKLRR